LILILTLISTLTINLVSFEEFTQYTAWSPPAPTRGTVTIPAYSSHTFQSTDTVIEAPGSESTVGMVFSWYTGFDPLRDVVTNSTVNNPSATPNVVGYDFTDCQGFDKFTGQSSGKIYKRNRSLWKFDNLGTPGDN